MDLHFNRKKSTKITGRVAAVFPRTKMTVEIRRNGLTKFIRLEYPYDHSYTHVMFT